MSTNDEWVRDARLQSSTFGTAVNLPPVQEFNRKCPECRGSCEDRDGNPCETCFGEGEI